MKPFIVIFLQTFNKKTLPAGVSLPPVTRDDLCKPFSKIKDRHFAGKQTGKMFSKYKSYGLIVLEQDPNRHG